MERGRQENTQQPVARLQEQRVLQIDLLGPAHSVLISTQLILCLSKKGDLHVSCRPNLRPHKREVRSLRHIEAPLSAGQVQGHTRVYQCGATVYYDFITPSYFSAFALELWNKRRRTTYSQLGVLVIPPLDDPAVDHVIDVDGLLLVHE